MAKIASAELRQGVRTAWSDQESGNVDGNSNEIHSIGDSGLGGDSNETPARDSGDADGDSNETPARDAGDADGDSNKTSIDDEIPACDVTSYISWSQYSAYIKVLYGNERRCQNLRSKKSVVLAARVVSALSEELQLQLYQKYVRREKIKKKQQELEHATEKPSDMGQEKYVDLATTRTAEVLQTNCQEKSRDIVKEKQFFSDEEELWIEIYHMKLPELIALIEQDSLFSRSPKGWFSSGFLLRSGYMRFWSGKGLTSDALIQSFTSFSLIGALVLTIPFALLANFTPAQLDDLQEMKDYCPEGSAFQTTTQKYVFSDARSLVAATILCSSGSLILSALFFVLKPTDLHAWWKKGWVKGMGHGRMLFLVTFLLTTVAVVSLLWLAIWCLVFFFIPKSGFYYCDFDPAPLGYAINYFGWSLFAFGLYSFS